MEETPKMYLKIITNINKKENVLEYVSISVFIAFELWMIKLLKKFFFSTFVTIWCEILFTTFVKRRRNIIVVWISKMKIDDFYHSGFSDFCLHLYCYIHTVSAKISSGLLQMFLIKLRSLHRTLNSIFYLIDWGHLLWFH